MSDRAVVERALARMQQAGAAQAEAGLVASDELEVRVRGDEIDFVQQAQSRSLRMRAFAEADDGLRQASTSTSDFSPEEIDRMADQTVALARATASDPHAGLPREGFADELPELALYDPADRPWKVDEHIEAARRSEAAARAVDPRITNSEGSQSSAQFSDLVYGNSAGFVGEYAGGHYSLYAAPLAEADGTKQVAYWHTASRTLAGLDDAAEIGRIAAERAVQKLGARPVSTCEVAVIFDNRVASSLLGHLFGCLSGYSLYRGSTFLADRLGETIASERVTVVDDGRLSGGLGSRPFDGEGLPTRRNVIVSGGRLETYVYDTYSARKLGAASTGSASAGGGVGATNLWLEPGEVTLSDLIADTERGLLVTELMGMGFNPVTGDYSRGAAGLWIENGEIAYPVHEVTIASHLGRMLTAIDAVANDLEWRSRVASPSLRVAAMTVAGE